MHRFLAPVIVYRLITTISTSELLPELTAKQNPYGSLRIPTPSHESSRHSDQRSSRYLATPGVQESSWTSSRLIFSAALVLDLHGPATCVSYPQRRPASFDLVRTNQQLPRRRHNHDEWDAQVGDWPSRRSFGLFEHSFSPSTRTTTISTCLVRPPRQLSIPQRCRRRCWHFLLLAQPFFSFPINPRFSSAARFVASLLRRLKSQVSSARPLIRPAGFIEGRVSCNYFHILNQKSKGPRDSSCNLDACK